jgi:hypothetical protein
MRPFDRLMMACVALVGLVLQLGAATTAPSAAVDSFPKPSPYPKSWELKFEHSDPKRVVVQAETSSVPKAYWYITYTVTNETDREQLFLPQFDLVTKDGKVIRSDKNIAKKAFDTIKSNEGNPLMVNHALIGGQLRLGIDEAKDGVAIWEEPDPEMGNFSVFISGMSGETATVKGPDGKPVILRKTLQLNYLIRGDAQTTGQGEVVKQSQDWVMR